MYGKNRKAFKVKEINYVIIMTLKKDIEPGPVRKEGNIDIVEGSKGREQAHSTRFLIRMSMVFICVLILLSTGIGVVGATTWSSGWESEKALVRYGYSDKWSIGGYAYPHIAYNLRGDGKWVLISHRQVNNYHPFGYYYDDSENKWVDDSSLVNGLPAHCWQEYSAFAYNVTGDGKWTLISHCHDCFFGYYWNGTHWMEDTTRVDGLPDNGLSQSGRTSHTLIEDLKGDGKWTLLSGTGDGTFRAFYWNGTGWINDTSRVNGLPDIGRRSRATAGYNVFGESKWNLITATDQSKFFRVFRWNGTHWNEDTIKAGGLNTTMTQLGELVPTLGYNVTGNGKWVLISGVEQLYTLLGFFYNTVDTSSLPPQTNITSYHPLGTTVRINFSYSHTWDHKIKYSVYPNMSKASGSEMFEDMDEADIKLKHLIPNTTYYYQAYTYVPWNHSYYANSTIYNFTTKASQNPITINPGDSIQDALEMLPLEGGTANLAAGIHNVSDTIIIDMSNITIQGTHSSEIRSCDSNKDVFIVSPLPDKVPSQDPFWDDIPPIENFLFKGFKITSTYDRGNSDFIEAWKVKNFTIEAIYDSSYADRLVALSPSGIPTRARNEDIYIRNNTMEHCGFSVADSDNVFILNNTILGSRGCWAIYASHGLKHTKIIGNRVINAGSNAGMIVDPGQDWEIRDNYFEGSRGGIDLSQGKTNVLLENNTITGARDFGIMIKPQAPMHNVTIRNNRMHNNGIGILTTQYQGASGVTEVNITNNVICNNTDDGIKMTSEFVALNICNNIITNNTGYGINNITADGNWSHSYNNIWGNTQGKHNGTTSRTGEIEVDPLFADPANGDFHLKSRTGRWDCTTWVTDSESSLCIDAGDPDLDYSNEPKPNGKRINIGAYGNTVEASKSPPPTMIPIYPPSSPVSDVEGETRTFSITIDQVVNVTWLINGTQVKPINESVTEASYTITSAEIGTWNVSAIATSVTTGSSAIHTWIWIVQPAEFETGPGTYPSISGTHNGTITPGHDVIVSKMYTYPCAGTGGHSESVGFYNDSWSVEANWSGYQSGDYHFITFDEQFTLESEITYNYTVRTGSYPQIHHTDRLEADDGVITCISFKDANGKRYNNWIPAIRLG